MFTFTNDCLIGISEIDDEHRKLFDIIESADNALKSEDTPFSDALLLISELKHYAETHFEHEEDYMQRINDPELERQQKEHSAFIDKIDSYHLTDVTEESAKAIMFDLLEYLSKWLMGHILGSDILIGQFQQSSQKVLSIPVFDDRFKTGIIIIDNEHQKLFDIIGKVHNTINTEYVHDKFDAVVDILNELKEYTQVHFTDEEAYMQKIGYAGLEQQKILHQNFIDKLNELDLDDIDNHQEAYLYDFLEFLQNWLVNHILKVDKLIP